MLIIFKAASKRIQATGLRSNLVFVCKYMKIHNYLDYSVVSHAVYSIYFATCLGNHITKQTSCMTTQLRKTLLATFSLLFLLGIASIQNKAAAQLQVGGGLAYGSDIESAGVQIGGTYFLLEEQGIRLAADLLFFFPGDDVLSDINVWEFNANGHYIFNEGDAFLAYALAGLSLATISIDFGGVLGEVSSSELGLNAGAGIEYGIGGIKLYGEGKLVLGGFDQLVLSGGVRVPIGNN